MEAPGESRAAVAAGRKEWALRAESHARQRMEYAGQAMARARVFVDFAKAAASRIRCRPMLQS